MMYFSFQSTACKAPLVGLPAIWPGRNSALSFFLFFALHSSPLAVSLHSSRLDDGLIIQMCLPALIILYQREINPFERLLLASFKFLISDKSRPRRRGPSPSHGLRRPTSLPPFSQHIYSPGRLTLTTRMMHLIVGILVAQYP